LGYWCFYPNLGVQEDNLAVFEFHRGERRPN